jgi:hypothetical protein
MKLAIILAAALATAACTTPIKQPAGDYAVAETPDGFTVTVRHSRYQFVPETAAVQQACRAQLLAAAHEVAERKGRRIEQVNEQRIQISTGRNGLTGITSCEASAPVRWA